jgi:hypothetical protein
MKINPDSNLYNLYAIASEFDCMCAWLCLNINKQEGDADKS